MSKACIRLLTTRDPEDKNLLPDRAGPTEGQAPYRATTEV